MDGVGGAARLDKNQSFPNQALDPLRLKGRFFVVFIHWKGNQPAHQAENRQPKHQQGEAADERQRAAVGLADVVPGHHRRRQMPPQPPLMVAADKIECRAAFQQFGQGDVFGQNRNDEGLLFHGLPNFFLRHRVAVGLRRDQRQQNRPRGSSLVRQIVADPPGEFLLIRRIDNANHGGCQSFSL